MGRMNLYDDYAITQIHLWIKQRCFELGYSFPISDRTRGSLSALIGIVNLPNAT